MKLGTRVRGTAFVAGLLVLAAGCTTSSADGQTSTAVVSLTVSPSVVDPSTFLPSPSAPPASPSPSVRESSTPSSPDSAAQEAADRAAIEAQWLAFWDVYRDMIRAPDDQREPLLSKVATSPLKEAMITEARNAQAAGQDNYGTVRHRTFWDIPVDGNKVATIADCQDQTGTGIVEVSTGRKITEGVDGIEIRGQMVEGEDGPWRVQALFEAGDSNC